MDCSQKIYINMKKEFIPYEQALTLKELGFDEPCFGYYGDNLELIWKSVYAPWINSERNLIDNNFCTAPTFSQAFRFFREVYKINPQIAFCEYSIESENSWKFTFDNPTKRQFWQGEFDNYEEAELECLKKLIEIIKQ